MDGIDDANVPTEVLHHGRDRASYGWCDQKMHVFSHEHVRVDCAASSRRRFCQALKIKPPIRVSKDARGAVVAALADVLRYAGQFEARRAGHASITRYCPEGFAAARFVTGKFL